MNKEIKDRLDKLENELKESKNEIHSLKSSVSFTIERGIGKLLSRFTRKQLILGSVIALFLISIIGIAGTVTKTYTFSSGDVVSASKINTNFDTLFTLVNGNLDDNNISGISGSKITSGTISSDRIDNISATKIVNDQIIIFKSFMYLTNWDSTSASSLQDSNNHLRGDHGYDRSQVDAVCQTASKRITKTLGQCNNVRSLISLGINDEIRDMVNNYSVPESKKIYNAENQLVADNFAHLISGKLFYNDFAKNPSNTYWTGSDQYGVLSSNTCNSWTSGSGSGTTWSGSRTASPTASSCFDNYNFLCICF
jgi:hypothetical protein